MDKPQRMHNSFIETVNSNQNSVNSFAEIFRRHKEAIEQENSEFNNLKATAGK